MSAIRSPVRIYVAKGQMPLRGSRSHWRVLGATQSGSTYFARSGGVARRSAFSGLLNSRSTRTNDQPPPVGGKPFGYDSLLIGDLCCGELCLAAAVAAPSTTTATTTAAPSAARPPSQREEEEAAAAAIPSRRERRRNARRSANGDAIKDGGPVQFVTRRPDLV